MNFKGTQDPSWQNVQLQPIIRRWLQQADIGPVDEIAPMQAGAPAMGMAPQLGAPQTPSVQIPGAELGGPVAPTVPVQPQTGEMTAA